MAVNYETYQPSPCVKEVYDYVTTGVIPDEWGVTGTEILQPCYIVKIYLGENLKAVVTNLPCSDKNSDGTVDVYALDEIEISDAIDPTMCTEKTPTSNFSYHLGLPPTASLDDVKSLTDWLENAYYKVNIGFVKYDASDLRDDDGDYKHPYDDSYFVNVITTSNALVEDTSSYFGEYIVNDVSYDYSKDSTTVSGTLSSFYIMDNVFTFEKDSTMLPFMQKLIQTGPDATGYSYVVAFNLFEKMFFIVPNNPIVPPQKSMDKRCKYEVKIGTETENKSFRFEDSVDLSNPVNWNKAKIFGEFDLFGEATDTRPVIATNPYVKATFDGSTGPILGPLCGYVSNDTLFNAFREFAIINNLWLLPTYKAFTNSKYTMPPFMLYGDSESPWRVLSGVKPTENPFPAETQDTSYAVNNAGWYYAPTDDVYKVSPLSVINDVGVSNESTAENVSYIKGQDIDAKQLLMVTVVDNVTTTTEDNSTQYENFELKSLPNTAGYTLPGGAPKTEESPYYVENSEDYQLYMLPHEGEIPLPEGYWYDEVSTWAALFGNDNKAKVPLGNVIGSPQAGMQCGVVYGRKVVNAYALYDTNLKLLAYGNYMIDDLYTYKPFSLKLRKVPPIEGYQNINGESVAPTSDDDKSVELKYFSPSRHIGYSKQILDRVNATNMKPLYQIEWTMKDDPYLRVGTLVYYPLKNTYVKAIIVSQTRTYDGGARLTNTAWVVEETDEYVNVFDLEMLNVELFYMVRDNKIVLTFNLPDAYEAWEGLPPIYFELFKDGESLGVTDADLVNPITIAVSYDDTAENFMSQKFELKSTAYITGETNTQDVVKKTVFDQPNDHPRLGEIVLSDEEEPLMAPDHLLRG